jgi:hypothetical protein
MPRQDAPVQDFEGVPEELADEQVVAPFEPPPPRPERVLTAPAPGYVWAPGYWYWYDGGYVWVAGSWLPPRPGHVYVGSRWAHTYDGWVFTSGGWSTGGGVIVYPVYRHSRVWRHAYPSHRHGYYRADRYSRAPRHRAAAPPAYVSRRRESVRYEARRSAPRAHAPRARPLYVRPRR